VARCVDIVEPAGERHLRVDTGEIEIGIIVEPLAEPAVDVPTQTQVEGQVGSDAEVVLPIKPVVVVGLPGSVISAGAGALVDRAQEELREAGAPCARDRIRGQRPAEIEAEAPASEIPVVVAAKHQATLERVLAQNLGDVIQERVGLHTLNAVLPLLGPKGAGRILHVVADDGRAKADGRHDLVGGNQNEIQPLHVLNDVLSVRHAVGVGRSNLVLAAEHGASLVDQRRTEGSGEAERENLIDGAIGLRAGNTSLGGRGGAVPRVAEIRVVNGIEQPLGEEFVLRRQFVVDFDRKVVSGLAATHGTDEIIAGVQAPARHLLERIEKVGSGKARDVKRRQRVDPTGGNHRGRKRRPAVRCGIIGIGIVDAPVRRGGVAYGVKPRIAQEVSLNLVGQGNAQKRGLALVQKGDVPGDKEERPALAVVKVRQIERPA